MSAQPTFLTPEQASARWGADRLAVRDGPVLQHPEIEDADGVWKPQFDAGLRLVGYRLEA